MRRRSLSRASRPKLDAFQPFIAQPGTTYALKIPDELFETARTIRGAVVRRAPGSGFWTTHPLFTAADPPNALSR